MNYPDSVQFLYSLGNEIKTAKLGLDRIAALLEALGRPQDRCRFVHVAGTNGKGSTCAMIESVLRTGGFRTGLFTSPHLIEPTERICINGQPVSELSNTGTVERGGVTYAVSKATGKLEAQTKAIAKFADTIGEHSQKVTKKLETTSRQIVNARE